MKEIVQRLRKWYFREWFVGIIIALSLISGFLTGIGFLGLIVPVLIAVKRRRLEKLLLNHATKVSELDVLEKKINEKEKIIQETIREATDRVEKDMADTIAELSRAKEELAEKSEELEKINKQVLTQERKVKRIKSLYKALEYALDNESKLTAADEAEAKEMSVLEPTVQLHKQSMNVQELRKAFKENEKAIQTVLVNYEKRYTTKTNKALYQLMALALSAELQNVLYNLKYTNLEKSNEAIRALVKKYLFITTDGNQSIAATMKRCALELECLYLNAVQIEYSYYIAKEQQKNEQAAIREQMKQEAEERKELQAQQKMIEKEESKYLAEIEKAKEQLQLQNEQSEKSQQLLDKIAQLEAQLKQVTIKKDEVIKRQNGKAGYVYIISNLGAFGEDVFKIGMTRRLDPMDRIKELGSASVPFLFDVHSFIFSDDAVALEQKMHEALDSKRLNKINLKKEFFKVNLDELEELVMDIDPTAEFNRTMVAEQYRQTLALS